MAVLAKLTPIIRGWAAYYRGVVLSRLFSSLDHYLWQLLYKWATWSHANKPKSWIVGRYFGKFNKFRNDRWVFGRDSDTYLVKFSWTDIVRHVMVKGTASPDDPALADYGPNDGKRSSPRSTGTRCACSPGRTLAVRSAGTTGLPPSSHPSPPSSGNNGGCRSPGKR